MNIQKKCKHGRGVTGKPRLKAWRKCGCAWVASVTVGGVRSYVNLGSDETQASAALLRLQADNMEGRVMRVKPGRQFNEVADSYLNAIRAAGGARPNRVRTTTSRVERLRAYWGDVPVDAITIEHVRVFIDDARDKYAPNTAGAIYSSFRSVMGHAQDHGLVGALPLPARSRLPRVNKRAANHVTVTEAGVIISALPEPYAAMAEIALLTGLRVGEVAALDAQDFDRERRVLHVRGTLAHDGTVGPPKTASGMRAVPLSPRAYEILDAAAGSGRVFVVPSLAMCGFVMRETLQAVGLHRPGRGWHALRHAHQAMLEASGLGLRDAAARMGHGANMAQTMAYGWAAEAGDAADVDATRIRLHRGHSKREVV
jgi:integrase